MDCDDAEEARDLLRHKNSNVTRAIYRAHSVIVGVSSCAPVWKGAWKDRPTPKRRTTGRGHAATRDRGRWAV